MSDIEHNISVETNEKLKISKGTIARALILLLALVNQVLTAKGYNVINISDETVNELVSVIFTIVAAVVGFWRNNSFTQPALKADEVMKQIKSSK